MSLKMVIPSKVRSARWFKVFPRAIYATRYYNRKYAQILNWSLASREDTNFTYALTESNIRCLISTISVVLNRPRSEVEQYINEAQNDLELKNFVIQVTNQSSFNRVADLKCEFGRRLGWYAFVRLLKPKIIIETGIDKGLGAVLLCAALLRNANEGHEGQYYGTDINPNAGYLLTGVYTKFGTILYGDSIASLTKLDKKIDLFINDSDHSQDYEYQEYQAIKDKLNPNSVILGDNSHCTDKLLKFSEGTDRKFLFFREEPKDHWYPGGGIGISF